MAPHMNQGRALSHMTQSKWRRGNSGCWWRWCKLFTR